MTAPVFAVVGHPNKGKSSLVATLARDDTVRISAQPGTTVRAARYPMRVDGETLYVLVDTPGFQRARRALAWMRRHAASAADRPDAVRRFVAAHRAGGEFPDECELLAPVVEGAGIIYVVDGAVPYGAEYETEMEILRWTGRPSLAIVNPIGKPSHVPEWERALGQYFRVVRVLDAVQATFEKRLALLRAFGELDEAWRAPLARAVDALERDRDRCLDGAARAISRMLATALSARVEQRVTEDGTLAVARERAQEGYRVRLRELERACRAEVEDLYHHHGVSRREGELQLIEEDLFAEQTWLLFGLRARQLAGLGAAGGAAAGAGIDVLTGGASLLLGSALGAALGGALGWLAGGKLAELRVVHGPFGTPLLRCGPARSVNLGFVLLGRARYHHAAVAGRTHAQRAVLDLTGAGTAAPALEAAPRRALAAAFERLRKTDPADAPASRQRGEVQALARGLIAADVGR